MSRFRFAAAVLLSATLAGASCSDVDSVTSTAPSVAQPLSLSVQPERVVPELLPAFGGCVSARAFRVSLVLVPRAAQIYAITSVRATFTDRAGVATTPTVVSPVTLAATSSGSSLPVPLPSSNPVPFPTSGPNNGLTPSASSPLPLTFEFGCHVRPAGTLTVLLDTRDGRGRHGNHRLDIEVGE